MSKISKEKRKFRKRSGFIGPVITSGNRGVYFERFKKDWLLKIDGKGNPDKLSDSELDYLSDVYAKFEIKREQKHLKAYMKGAPYYKHAGQFFPVLTPQVLEQKAMEMQQMANMLQQNSEEE